MFGEVFIGSFSVKAQSFRTAYSSAADSKAAKNKRFYAVHYGELDGEVIKDFITESWTQCRRIVEGVSGSIYKSFLSHGKAREFLAEQKLLDVQRSQGEDKSSKSQEPLGRSGAFKPKAPFSLSEPQPVRPGPRAPVAEPGHQRVVDLDEGGESCLMRRDPRPDMPTRRVREWPSWRRRWRLCGEA